MTQTIVLLYFQGITAMEQLDLNSPDADPFSPGAVVTSSTTADPFAPATSPPLQPPPPLRPPQAVPRAAPRQAPAPVVPPAAAPVQPAPSADLFGEVQVFFFPEKIEFFMYTVRHTKLDDRSVKFISPVFYMTPMKMSLTGWIFMSYPGIILCRFSFLFLL